MGVADLWRQRRRALTRWLLPAAIAATGAWGFVLLSRTPEFVPWLRVPVLAASLVAALVLLAPLPRRLALAAVAAGLVAVLAAPAAYVVDTIATSHSGAIVSAGPTASPVAGGAPQGPGGGFAAASRPAGGMRASFQPPGGASAVPSRSGSGGGAGTSTALVNYLLAHRGSATWIAAEVGSNHAAGRRPRRRRLGLGRRQLGRSPRAEGHDLGRRRRHGLRPPGSERRLIARS
jgi:hypothetical protein